MTLPKVLVIAHPEMIEAIETELSEICTIISGQEVLRLNPELANFREDAIDGMIRAQRELYDAAIVDYPRDYAAAVLRNAGFTKPIIGLVSGCDQQIDGADALAVIDDESTHLAPVLLRYFPARV